MAEDTSLRNQRPDEGIWYKDYTSEPKYYPHKYYEDRLAILVCQIKIWKAEGRNWFKIPDADQCLTIRECESVEITDSSKDLVNKAVVKFPRGTVVQVSSDMNKKVKVGTEENLTTKETTLKDATNNADLITSESSQYKEDGTSIVSMSLTYDDKGLVEYNRIKKDKTLLNSQYLAVGHRIEIRLGYAYSDKEFRKMNSADHKDSSQGMDICFTGFITSVSADTPLEIECTNMAHVLTSVATPDIPATTSIQVKDFLDDGGKWHLLQDTGIPLAEFSKDLDMSVSGGAISHNLNVADVLKAWADAGIASVLHLKDDGSVELRVGWTYYAGTKGTDLPNNDRRYITYNGGNNTVTLIQFDWDVANDKLTLKQTDKKYLAVKAIGKVSQDQSFQLTIRKNPDLDDEGWMVEKDGQFQTVNSHKVTNRKKAKYVNGTLRTKKVDSKATDPVKMKDYNVVTYQSLKVPITEEELIEEAKQYWGKCAPNGISGNLTIFGDVYVSPTDIIGLIDTRHPQKNGYYYVESVQTTFGTGGYRRELKIPFKIASFSKDPVII